MEALRPGLFITLEGGEGAGKSTLAKGLKQKLEQSGAGVVVTREPGGTPRGEAIRGLLFGDGSSAMTPTAQALLFAAARDDHLNHLIRPALQRGTHVICDRFSDSTRAYQGAAQGVDVALIDALEKAVVGETRPDITFLIDIAPETGLARIKGRSDNNRLDNETLEFHNTQRKAYLTMAAKNPQRFTVLDGAENPAQILDKAWKTLAARLNLAAH